MTLDEILACEIPEGKYYWALRFIKGNVCNEFIPQDRKNSLCASFEVLLKLAKEPNGYFYPIADPVKFQQQERTKSLDDVLGVVDYEKLEYMSDCTLSYDRPTVEDIRKRIEALRDNGTEEER